MTNRHFVSYAIAGLAAGLTVATAHAANVGYWYLIVREAVQTHHASAPDRRENWSGFSPDGIGMPLVLYGIYSARQTIHVLAYLITNRDIISALAEKARQGVQVTVVVDYGESIEKDRNGYIRRGLRFLSDNGVAVCATSAFRLMHDKSMVIDGRHVQTGSINYTGAAEQSNSEDALIAWNDPENAVGFEQHFSSRQATCQSVQ
jgi:phosphatidylserine/phosphatidylglycerophosphate/cardiolipin synthase-like enzyme